jgi:hypothetical protein
MLRVEPLAGLSLGIPSDMLATAGCAVLAPRGTPHTYWNARNEETRYLLVMTPKLARMIAAIHEPGADVPALFAAHDSELLPAD